MSIVRVAFQYDYQCDQIGMFAFLVKVTDFTTAAKCVMAMGNPERSHLKFAVKLLLLLLRTRSLWQAGPMMKTAPFITCQMSGART